MLQRLRGPAVSRSQSWGLARVPRHWEQVIDVGSGSGCPHRNSGDGKLRLEQPEMQEEERGWLGAACSPTVWWDKEVRVSHGPVDPMKGNWVPVIMKAPLLPAQ